MKRFFQDLNKYKGYMFHSAKAQLKAELASSWLGSLWWVLEPTLFMFVYMFVYNVVFQRTTDYLVAFIIIGMTYWRFFNTSVMASITLVKHYRAVILKVYIPKFVLVGSLLLVNGFKMLCSYIPIIVMMIYYGVPVGWHMLMILPVTAVLFLFTFAICCWCMHIGVYVEDLKKLMNIVLQVIFYMSGVFYPINEMLAPALSNALFTFNPTSLLLYEARNALLYAAPVHWVKLCVIAGISLVLAVLGIWKIYRAESQYVKVI